MTEFESIEKLVREFGEENKALIENKLEVIVVKFDEIRFQNNKAIQKIEDLDKRMYAVENHPTVCDIIPRVSQLEVAFKSYLEENLPERQLKVEQDLLVSRSIKKWLIASITLTATAFGIITAVLKLFNVI